MSSHLIRPDEKDPSVSKWIQGLNLKKGSFTKDAKAHGKTVHQYAEEKKHAGGKVGKRARLALTFEHMASGRIGER